MIATLTPIGISYKAANDTDMSIIKSIFFNAPIENYDSTTFDYFMKDPSFRYEDDGKKWRVSSEVSGSVEYSFPDFWFTRHPLFTGFDSGRVMFQYAKSGDRTRPARITLEAVFPDTAACSKAYAALQERLSLTTDNTVKVETVGYGGVKRLFVGFTKIRRFDGEISYWAELYGD